MMRNLGLASQGRDNHFNLLRMLAAGGVIVSHAWPLSIGIGTPEPLIQTGYTLGVLCVFLFFGISGFYITRSFDRKRDWRVFLEARLRRLLPGLLAVLLIIVAAGTALTTASWYDYMTSTINYVVRGITLEWMAFRIAGLFEDAPYPRGVNGSLWTLRYEFFFYMLVLAVGLLGGFAKVWRARAIVLGLIVLTVVLQAIYTLEMAPEWIDDKRALLGLPFALGAALYLWRDQIVLSWTLAAVLGVVAWLAHGTVIYTPLLQLALIYGVLVIGFAKIPALLAYNRLGDYSYGFYIYAFPIQQLATYWGADTPLTNLAVSIPATLICAIASWYLIEKPAMDGPYILGRLLPRKTPPAKEV